jgi:hypothetical protein
MRFLFTILLSIFILVACSEDANQSNNEKVASNLDKESSEDDTTYQQYVSKNHIKSIEAKGFAYKFGEPDGDGSILYKVIYNQDGYVLDSLIYNDNKVIATLSNEYNDQNKLLVSVIKDSVGNVQQKVERTYDAAGNVLTFKLVQNEEVLYSQKMTYDGDKMTKIVEFDKLGNPRIVTNYEYNESGKLITNSETDENGKLLKKTSLVYDNDGNNSVQTIYNSTGQVAEKNFLKNYDSNGNAQLVEKYDGKDSLIVTYEYGYNKKGEEIKSIIYDGVGQIIRQSMSTFDTEGKQIGYEIYEGGKGFIGKDEIKYNEKGKEIQLLVLDKDNKQLKRKTSSYNEKELIKEVINYDKLDEPVFKINFDYSFFEKSL